MTCYENTTQDIYDAHKAETGACFHLDKGRIVVASGSASVGASGSASVRASGSASVEAYGSASVEAYGSASVRAYDSASVEASGSASVGAYDSASVRAYGSASVRASGSASVRASGSASVEAYGSASVEAYGSASVRASGSASVEASGSASVGASGSASVGASGSASVVAYDSASVRASGSASVVAYDSASVRAYDSASVVAYGSASVGAYDSASVEAYDSASVRAYGSASVEAYDSASVRAYGSASVRATPAVPVQQYPGYHGTTTGGVTITIPDLASATPAEWAAYYGIKPAPAGGHIIVYKAVDDRLLSGYGMAYPVGQTVTAPDWKPVRDCGHGLHFGPTPRLARTYHRTATRFLACQVKTADMVPLGDKVKAPSCTVLYETDIRGQRITARTTPDMITELAAGEVIVVGTNKDGVHAGGAAKQAAASFGLADGTGEGPSGSTYALPTMEGPEALAAAAGRFLGHARQNPETTFLLTKVGCGIAGYAEADVAPLFAGAPVNVVLPAGWAAVPAAS